LVATLAALALALLALCLHFWHADLQHCAALPKRFQRISKAVLLLLLLLQAVQHHFGQVQRPKCLAGPA
jgi:hypothetical protein